MDHMMKTLDMMSKMEAAGEMDTRAYRVLCEDLEQSMNA